MPESAAPSAETSPVKPARRASRPRKKQATTNGAIPGTPAHGSENDAFQGEPESSAQAQEQAQAQAQPSEQPGSTPDGAADGTPTTAQRRPRPRPRRKQRAQAGESEGEGVAAVEGADGAVEGAGAEAMPRPKRRVRKRTLCSVTLFFPVYSSFSSALFD